MEYTINMGFCIPHPYLYYVFVYVFCIPYIFIFPHFHIPIHICICILDRRLGDWFQFSFCEQIDGLGFLKIKSGGINQKHVVSIFSLDRSKSCLDLLCVQNKIYILSNRFSLELIEAKVNK